MTHPQKDGRRGVLLGLAAYLIWGAIPLYFKTLERVGPSAVVAHRVIWSLVLLAALLSIWHRWDAFWTAFVRPKVMLVLALTALLISSNWLIYIWAVLNGHLTAASLGYYLNPLVNVLLGVVLLKERLSRVQALAVLLAGVGVAVLAAGAASALWISLTLAFSFSLYGLLRKVTPVEAVEGLSVETLLLVPAAVAWLAILHSRGQPSLGADTTTGLLLVLSGPVTAIPLLLFNAAAKRLPYSTLGILQYITPTIQLLIAVLLFGETLTPSHMICFGVIWVALIIFAVEGLKNSGATVRERAGAV